MLIRAKKILENIPEPIGRALKYIPFNYRIGKGYSIHLKKIEKVKQYDSAQIKNYILKNFKNILCYAYHYNNFYNTFYKKHKFSPDQVIKFEDIIRVPIVTKNDLQEFSLKKRTNYVKGCYLANTGGTSGETLNFYLHHKILAREWAHIHYIWKQLGYSTKDLKLTFKGRNLGNNTILKYNSIHNEYVVNLYCSIQEIVLAIEKLINKKKIRFIHGYPSAIYNFASYCASNNSQLASSLASMLKGILLGSEYPAPVYRNVIEQTFRVPTISWYGHSEMVILAYEQSRKYEYVPFQSYGYCEAVPYSNGKYRLIGTSYDNFVSPFIRYDTNDLIKPVIDNGILQSFTINHGRVGEFIVDKAGNKISLTALIFGRHHKLFNVARYIQLYQEKPGFATILITLPADCCYKSVQRLNWESLFDASNVDIEFSFKTLNQPIRTVSGKVPLLVTHLPHE